VVPSEAPFVRDLIVNAQPMIVLQFVRGADAGADLIAWFSHGGYSHVDAVLSDGLLGARSDRAGCKPPGVQVRAPGYVKGCEVLRIELEATPDMAKTFETFLRAQVGKPYDHEGIAGFIVGRDWRDDSAWFCSELQSAALEACGYFTHPLSVPANKITPADLLLALSVKTFVPYTAPVVTLPHAAVPILNGAE
jgi:hypothetical protein